ncbi:hypothetical protein ACQ4M4_08290 [Leptolyngbya sp. AN02str]|uniref:hypothetical protein n=1 Tax=Leptolyngbya sp. AN02str TaxID=3423363 RepID=UPI003D3207D2
MDIHNQHNPAGCATHQFTRSPSQPLPSVHTHSSLPSALHNATGSVFLGLLHHIKSAIA